ncbi:TPA: TIGR03757 family integrating conjugative element protein [Citrobacter freundii]|nr:TIGR03757 family integrating conjugative element protein [Citrobacter freundii]
MRLFFILFVLFSAYLVPGASAQTVIYTTPLYPVSTATAGMMVQILEDIQQLEQSLFPVLSDHAAEAEQQVIQQMQLPGWREQEARLTQAYQALFSARSAGIEKVPAVVFDDRFVVYGTTDIRLAQQKYDVWQEQQP